MEGISRTGVVTLAAAATASAAAGLALHADGGRATPPSLLQYTAVTAGTAVLGSFILWHRPRNRYGLTHLAISVLFGLVLLAGGVLSRAAALAEPTTGVEQAALALAWLSAGALLPLWVVAIAGFPDGRLHRPVVRRGTVVVAIAMPLLAVVAYLLAPNGEPLPLVGIEPPVGLAGPLATAGGDPHPLYLLAATGAAVLGAMAPLAAVVALLDRFRHAGPVLRQQIKWLLLGASISVALQAVPLQAIGSGPLRTVVGALVVAAAPVPLVAAGIAIFKHRLWEIDVVISKGLVYAVVSAALAGLFLGVALVAGVSVGGRDQRVVAALVLALLVSLAAQPLRKRLERVVSRVLYGDEPRGFMALAQLAQVADAVTPAPGVRDVATQVVDAARAALGASWAVVVLRTGRADAVALRFAAGSGAEPGPSGILPPEVTASLGDLSKGLRFADLPEGTAEVLRPFFTEEPAAIASMGTPGHVIGLLACGPRPRSSYADDDVELLAAVARQSALALRNLRLEEELRGRLEVIEQQAAELHSSRQRLVTAQDQERRRIERDLHDGAQQQLVALAARLRRAAAHGGSGGEVSLDELADEAEEAVFTLQELGRGIYPSLLADRGLQAALRASASRLPENVRVDVAPRLHGQRLEPELEAALYFVALEAMTNAVKHAPGANITVSLTADPHRRTVTLEVHDDGPGLDTRATTPARGLQNMADRIEALGGVLAVESVRGGGTWVRAEVRRAGEVGELRRRGATRAGRSAPLPPGG